MNDSATEVTAMVATQIIKDTLSAIYEPISNIVTVKRGQFIERFSNYCTYIHGKNSLVRTLYSKNKPMNLSDVYVKTKFEQGDRTFTDVDLINKFASGQRIIVKGNGGSGKTIFLKHLWVSRFEKSEGRIPIFVELRRLNDLQKIDIASFCRNELQSDMSFGKGVFEKLCEAGKFEFIFDGFDEVNRVDRKVVEREIISLSDKYRNCSFLVSGREDDRFSSWSDFQTYSVAPLNLPDVRELVKKIPFDRGVRKKFLTTLDDSFYEQHQSFLSSPLLACMMLMTFNENAIIPTKLAEFYKSAFQTLLTWHDATKDSFERDRALSVDEFRRVFSTFCLTTYYNQAYEFDDEQFRRYLIKALDYHSIEADVDSVVHDVCESANLLQKDGLKFLFVHRSFQEYFAAECAMHVVSGKADEFLKVFAQRRYDTVFGMCYEIHPELVYDRYFAGRFEWLKEEKVLLNAKGGFRHDTPWTCTSIAVDVASHENEVFQLVDINTERDEKAKEIKRIFSLSNQVLNEHFHDPAIWAMTSAIRSVAEITDKELLCSLEQTLLRVTITFEGKSYKVSVRNRGENKVPAEETKKFRAQFLSQFSDRMKRSRIKLNEYYDRAEQQIESLTDERRAKERSIDDILGLSAVG